MNSLCQFILLASISANVFGYTNVETVDVTCEYEQATCTIPFVDYRFNRPNNLNVLNANATEDTIHFKMIEGRYNTMPLNLFKVFPKLEKLEISIELKAITGESFIGGSMLKELDLSFNRIKEIHPHTFDGMDKLEYIDLNTNKLAIVKFNAFAGAPNLKWLDLKMNQIDTIEEGAFNIPTLEKLDLSDNNLDSLAYDVFVGCPNLMAISLGGNELAHIGKAIENVPKLNWMSFSSNNYKIFDFDFYAIARKPNLKTYCAESVALILDDPASAANDNYTVNHLDISGNNLSYPDILHRLRNFRNLIHLNISKNNFTTINDLENILEMFPKLEELEANHIPGRDEVYRRLYTKFGRKITLKYLFQS